MHIIQAGVHYQAVPLDIREKIIFSADAVDDAMLALKEYPDVSENVILSTCNRTEIYASVEDTEAGFATIKQFLSDWFDMEEAEFAPFLKLSQDDETIMHLFRMTAGLDSMVIGETQILGQVKDAFTKAQKLQTTQKVFNELFKRVITFAKRVHNETSIGEQAVSVSYVAVELAKKIFGDISEKHVLIIGAGETGELTLKNLHGAGAANITVANRTYRRASELAEKFRAEAVSFDKIDQVIGDTDIIISSTGSSEPVLTKEMLQPFHKERKGHPLFVIDMAVPRDIDSSVSDLESVFLYDIDDLESVTQENLAARKETAAEVEKQLTPELASFNNWLAMLDAVPVIKALQEKSLSIRKNTMASIHRKIPDLTERESKVLEKHTKSIVHQLLEEPIKQAKTMGNSEEELQRFREIFGLKNDS